MDIAQRGTSFAGLSVSSYTLDGWVYVSSGSSAVATVSQQADVLSGSECQNSLRVTVTTADASATSAKSVYVCQHMEGYLVRDLLGNPIALRFEVKSPKSGIHCVALRNSGSDRSYVAEYTINTANTWQTVTIPLASAGIPSSGTWNFTTGVGLSLIFPLMAGSNFQTTKDAWQNGHFFATSNQQNLLDTVSNVFAVTGVQIEKSLTSTALEHRDIASEMNLNQRYYQAGFNRWDGQATSGVNFSAPVFFKTTMRSAPTVALTNVGATSFSSTTASASVSIDGFWELRSATVTGNGAFSSNWTASAEL